MSGRPVPGRPLIPLYQRKVAASALELEYRLAVTLGVDHTRLAKAGLGSRLRIVNMDMPVEMDGGLKNTDKPAESFDASMRQIGCIVDPFGRRVSDENIQVAAEQQAVDQQAWDQG